ARMNRTGVEPKFSIGFVSHAVPGLINPTAIVSGLCRKDNYDLIVFRARRIGSVRLVATR
ncbi:MAG: hypothetical protein O7G83_19040, partial [Proteobacteria bacterium]|nr:hypothetical protein [Pseudomonadota bacterium]